MKVHLVSAIFVSPDEFRARHLQETMETLLADGLAARGVSVSVGGHSLTDRWLGDVVHIHHLANGCLRLALPQRSPIVFTRHATKDIPRSHRLVLRQTYRASSAVVALSDAERSNLQGVVPSRKLHRIYNGTNPAHFNAELRTRPVGRWRLLYVGQLIELKRVEIAVRMVATLVREGFDVSLDIVSHRPTLQVELERLSAALGISDRVNFLGPRTREELGRLLAASHVLVLPSRTEALPTVITEAVFSGLPVLAFDVGGVAEQIPSCVELPSPSDIRRYIDLGREMLVKYEIFAKLYADFVPYAIDKFSVDAMVDQHISIYESLVSRR